MKKTTLALMIACALSSPALANEAELKKEIDSLKKLLEAQAAQLQKLQTQANALADQQAKIAAAPAPMPAPAAVTNTASALLADTTIGGYGEITYNNYRNDRSRNQADLKRFVLFFGHRFNDQLSFNSEVEWEHAVTSATDQGETALEQAYLNYQFSNGVNIKTGLFLMPFGFLNPAHEPPVFYGVERNEVETRIIPSTWREGGIGVYGSTDSGFAWDVGVVTGFNGAKFDDPGQPLRSIHQEMQLAKAHDLSYYGALNYHGVPGLTVGGAMFTGNSLQGNADFLADNSKPNFSGINGRVTLWDVHTRWQDHGWDLQALYSKGRIGDADRIDSVLKAYNTANPTPLPYLSSEFYGWLTQAAYTVWESGDMSLTPFVRYEKFNTQSKMPDGFATDPVNADRVTTVGLSFKPHPQVVFKADYQKFKDNSINDRFNLGLGYMF